MSAIFKREFRTYFHSPLGYTFLATIYAWGGVILGALLFAGESEIRYIFSDLFPCVFVAIPFLTMGLLSEDKKLKTDQLLLTSPTNVGGIVWGKYFSAFTMYFIGILCTVVYTLILATFSPINWNIFLGNLLGLALLGAAFIAIGLFISSLTESQVVAAVVTLAFTVLIIFSDVIAGKLPEWLANILSRLSFSVRFNDLMGGILNISHIIFFISIVVLFNFLTVRVLEKKRWS